MHLNICHHASWHVVHHVKQSIIYYVWCTSVRRLVLDLSFGEGSSTHGVGAKSNIWISLWNLSFSATKATPGA